MQPSPPIRRRLTEGSVRATCFPNDSDAGRIEDRTVDGSCNPYLAATAMLAAGLDGIERELDAGEPNSANLYELSSEVREAQGIDLLPANLLDATRELERDDVLRKALGTTRDGDYVDYYIKVKRGEWQAAHEQITQWELDRACQGRRLGEVDHPQLVHQHGVVLGSPARSHQRVAALAEDQAPVLDRHRPDRDDLVVGRVKSGQLEIDRAPARRSPGRL